MVQIHPLVTSASLGVALFIPAFTLAHVQHPHLDEHNHEHDHQHHRHHNHNRRHLIDLGPGGRPTTDDGKGDPPPFGNWADLYASKKEFIESGSACGFREPDPATNVEIEERIAKRAAMTRHRPPNDGYVIDTYFHVITTGSGTGATGYVSDQDVQDQMTVLNDGFAGAASLYPNICSNRGGGTTPGGQATPFHFELKEINRVVNSGWYNNVGMYNNVERQMKSALRRGDCGDLNIYSTNGGGYLGWAYFPNNCDNDLDLDGVVVHSGSLPGGNVGSFDEGDTMTHEVGHWLGLHHTFNQGCNGAGDEVADTNAEQSATFGCPANQNSCGSSDPVHNFMDYTDDCCMYKFTQGQSDRMALMAEEFRGLVATPNGTPSPTPPPPTPQPTLAPVEAPPTPPPVQEPTTPEPTNAPTTPQPTSSCTAEFVFTIVTDEWPEETSWTLVNDADGTTVAHAPLGFYELVETQHTSPAVCLDAGATYTFTLLDTLGDGLCCGPAGEGTYDLQVDGTTVASGEGDFGYEKLIKLSVSSGGVVTACEDSLYAS